MYIDVPRIIVSTQKEGLKLAEAINKYKNIKGVPGGSVWSLKTKAIKTKIYTSASPCLKLRVA
jgi:hypothetical protein